MIVKKYKIGEVVLEIVSQSDFQNAEPYSLFLYDGEQCDYRVNLDFSSALPKKIENPFYVSQDRVYVVENGALHCFFKSRDNAEEYYARRISDGKHISIVIDEQYSDMLRADVMFSLVGIEEIVAENNGCVLHSSFIEKDGEAVLFSGPCNIGKSTQANLWRDFAHATVINGDKTFIFEKDGTFYASGMPFSGSSKDCLNRVVPLKAVICLEQADCNFAQRLGSMQSFYKLYKNCYPVPFSRDLTDKLIDFVQKLSQNVPVYEYACRADESAVRYLERELCPMQSL
ncbi:MAG: hypothetical protein J6R20_06615 [Clostridia bacterium]|nr:hypothetical protein [Clostridia bacterium]